MRTKSFTILKTAFLFIVVFVAIYASTFGYFIIREKYYKWKTYTYDLNKDGFFSPEEQTEEQKYWFERCTNDTYLMSLPTYALYPSFLGSILFLIGKGMIKQRKTRRTKKT